MGATVANKGKNPKTKKAVIDPDTAEAVSSVMMTCGRDPCFDIPVSPFPKGPILRLLGFLDSCRKYQWRRLISDTV